LNICCISGEKYKQYIQKKKKMKQWYNAKFENSVLKYIRYINLIVITAILTGLFFVPYAKVNIPTSSVYEFLKTQDGLFTIPIHISLIIITLFHFFVAENYKFLAKVNRLLIFLTILLILSGLLQIHLAENGHAGNLLFRLYFSLYNFQIGSFLIMVLLTLYTLHQNIIKRLIINSGK
jgi:hypothetical protein